MFILPTTYAFSQKQVPANSFISAAKLSDAATIAAVNQLKSELIACGWWDYIEVLYIGASDGINDTRENQHAWNFKNPSTNKLTWYGDIVHNTTGVHWNGSTGYADTGYKPSRTTSAAMGYYYTTRPTSSSSPIGIEMGISVTGFYSMIIVLNSDNLTYAYCNEGDSGHYLGGNTPPMSGLIHAIKDQNNGVHYDYFNGVVSNFASQTTPTLPDLNYFLGAVNGGGAAGSFTSIPMRVSFIGDYHNEAGLSQSALFSAFNNYIIAMDAR